jgi:hypothetical protein
VRLIVRLLGVTVLDIEADDGAEAEPDYSLGGSTTSTGFTAPALPSREGYEDGYED